MPGATFHVVDALLTNFHLPRSTLLMLVSAFAGREHVLAAYREAVARGISFLQLRRRDVHFVTAGRRLGLYYLPFTSATATLFTPLHAR